MPGWWSRMEVTFAGTSRVVIPAPLVVRGRPGAKRMTPHDAVTTQAALVAAALRLVDDHPDIAAGSVLRCFSRAVVIVRRTGTPSPVLADRAEMLARQMLAARNQSGSRWPLPAQERPDADVDLRAAPA